MRNREERLAYQREYYMRNREKIRERNRVYKARRRAEKAAMV